MNSASGVILSLAYILGLLSTGIPWGHYGLLVLTVGAAFVLPRFWRSDPKPRVWVMVGIIGLVAALYFQARVPQPAANDISKFVPANEVKEIGAQEQVVTVEGRVASMPRLTRSDRSQFWLEASQLNEVKGSNGKPTDATRKVTGKLYVTVPLLQATGLYPGEAIAVTGSLYQPKSTVGQGVSNFQSYLAREGGFAGLSGRQVGLLDAEQVSNWRWWVVRRRILQSQIRSLGIPEGLLVSAMVMGSQTVDLPYNIRDNFARIGLAHALAASGFQVSLILSVVLGVTKRLSARSQFICGVVVLVIFASLTGLQTSVIQAAVMGFGALVALVVERKVKPLGSLLVATAILLMFNPLWIWDLGFQLNFLVTMGLLVTVPPLTNWLNWLPLAIASLIVVPIAATVWTLPLQIYSFYASPYSIPANIITAALLSLISLGGFISALAALVWPAAGSTLAWLLYYPTHWLIALVQYFARLPGNSVAEGTISVLQLLTLYGLIGLVLLQRWWRRRWWLAGIVAVSLVVVPVWQTKTTLFRVTVLSAAGDPVLVIQDQGRVTLINSGNTNTATFTVLPFLQQQRISQIDWAVAVDSDLSSKIGWPQIMERLPVKTLYFNAAKSENEGVDRQEEQDTTKSSSSDSLAKDNLAGIRAIAGAGMLHEVERQPLRVGQTLPVGSITIKLISAYPTVLQLQIRNQTWLLLGDLKSADDSVGYDKASVTKLLPPASVLCWSGEALTADLLKVVQPTVAIASSPAIEPDTMSQLPASKMRLYWTGRDGALRWTPGGEFETSVEATENETSLL